MSLRRLLQGSMLRQTYSASQGSAFGESVLSVLNSPTSHHAVGAGASSTLFSIPAAWMSTKSSGLKFWKPTSPGQRFRVTVDYKGIGIWRGKPYAPLTMGVAKTGGRNNSGKITARHIGGGHRKKLRIIDFTRRLEDVPATVERLEYDPNRSGFLALVKYDNGKQKRPVYSYILAPQNIKAGDTVMSGKSAPIKAGSCFMIQDIPTGLKIHNIELYPGKGGQLCRAAGVSATLVQKGSDGYGVVRLPSGEQRKIKLGCRATIGAVSNPQHQNIVIGKAGIKRWMGKRPIVRGVAMNPIDHPHGGGEGKASGGRPSSSPWGWYTKGIKTRKNTRSNKLIVVSRHFRKK